MTRDLRDIEAALDREADSGRLVDVWWRDDDAVRDSAALGRLLSLAQRFGAPLAVAAIPNQVEPSLPVRLQGVPGVVVLPHGYDHANHAGPGEKPSEYGAHRPPAAIAAEVARAWALVEAAFGTQALPVFVPPWNRIAPSVEALLPKAGFQALSTFGPVPKPRRPDLIRLNVHLDPVDWRDGRSLAPPGTMTDSLSTALAREPGPIGLLTHHLMFDEPLWAWCEALLERLSEHPAVRLRSAAALMAELAPELSLSCGSPYGKVPVSLLPGGGAR